MKATSFLHLHRSVMRIAFSASNAFAWIFIFQYFTALHPVREALALTAILYALIFVISSLVTPYAAGRLRHGMKKSIVYGVLFATFAFMCLALSFNGIFGYQYVDGIVAFALFLGAYRALYWVPYSVESRGLQPYASPSPFVEILVALMPALSGFVLMQHLLMPSWLLFITGICIAFSLFPLWRVPDIYEKFSWGYEETFAQLFSHTYRLVSFRAIADGIQSAALFFLWPIAIFLIVGSSYVVLGAVLSITFLISLLLRKPIRSLIRNLNVRDVSIFYATIAMSAWIGRVLVASPVTIVLIDTYFHTGTAGRPGMDTLSFDQIADGGHFVDEYTALKEIGLGLGRATIGILAAFLSVTFSISMSFLVSFIIAAFAAGISVWLAHLAASREQI